MKLAIFVSGIPTGILEEFSMPSASLIQFLSSMNVTNVPSIQFSYFWWLDSTFSRLYFIKPYLTQSTQNESQHRDTTTFPNLNIPFASEGLFKSHTPDFYVPLFTLAEHFCYYGWIKVAESLLNPFGDDDENFCVDFLIDRNLQVGILQF